MEPNVHEFRNTCQSQSRGSFFSGKWSASKVAIIWWWQRQSRFWLSCEGKSNEYVMYLCSGYHALPGTGSHVYTACVRAYYVPSRNHPFVKCAGFGMNFSVGKNEIKIKFTHNHDDDDIRKWTCNFCNFTIYGLHFPEQRASRKPVPRVQLLLFVVVVAVAHCRRKYTIKSCESNLRCMDLVVWHFLFFYLSLAGRPQKSCFGRISLGTIKILKQTDKYKYILVAPIVFHCIASPSSS